MKYLALLFLLTACTPEPSIAPIPKTLPIPTPSGIMPKGLHVRVIPEQAEKSRQ